MPVHEDVAIIGMAGLFPEADDLRFWHDNLRSGRDSVRTLSDDRIHFGTLEPRDDYAPFGCLDRIDLFDPAFFGLAVSEAEYMDPHQRLTLQVACAAVENAGYSLEALRGTPTGVFLSVPRDDYIDFYPEANPLGLLGSATSAVPGRIAYLLDLRGPSLGIDAGCAGSLVAVDVACRDLAVGQARVALAGGLSLTVMPTSSDMQRSLSEIVSPDGRCKSFDAEANGAVGGEGGAVLVLKLLKNAVADGDRIEAVIKGSAVNQNGFRSNGLSAPSPTAQTEVILAAWERAGVDPRTIGYVEAHGSATRLGDVIEIQGLTEAFAAHGIGSGDITCAVGSVKTNVGHLDHAAGIAGLVKAVLSLRYKSLYPSLHFNEPNPLIDFERAPVHVNADHRAWVATDGNPRRAGVSSFSLAGANAHVVVEEAPENTTAAAAVGRPPTEGGRQLATVSAKSPSALRTYCESLSSHVGASNDPIEDIAFVMNAGRGDYRHRYAFTFADREELVLRLKEGASAEPTAAVPQAGRPLVLLFSGDAQIDGATLGRLASDFVVVANARDEVRSLIGAQADSPGARTFTAHYALHRLLRSLGLREAAVLGSGVGNLMARVVRETTTLEDAARDAATMQPTDVFDHERLLLAVEQFPGDPAIVEVGSDGILLRTVRENWDQLGALARPLLNGEPAAPVLATIAALHGAGVAIDWGTYYEVVRCNRVELPTYPFEKVRCWCREPGDHPFAFDERARAGAVAFTDTDTPTTATPLVDLEDERFGTDSERKVAAVWTDALKVPVEGPDADYFELGGTSVMALTVVDGLEAHFGLRILFEDLYEHSTVGQLASHLDALVSDGEAGDRIVEPKIVPVPRDQELLLSFEQERLWFLDRFEPNSPLYNIPMDIRFDGTLDTDALRLALRDLVDRHEMLRSRLPAVDGLPRMVIEPPGGFEVPVVDIGHLGPQAAEEEALRRLREEGAKPFNLSDGPLFRAQIVKLGPTDHVLFMTFHHIVDDGWSPAVLHREISAFYQARLEGRKAELPPLPIQYADYAQWQQNWLQGDVLSRKMEYWREHLAGAPPLDLPTDRPRPPVQTFRGGVVEFLLPSSIVGELRALSREQGVTTFSTLLAAFALLMSRYSGQDDFVVGTPTAGRNRPETRDLIGFFNNSVPLRVDLSGSPSFRDLLARMRMVVARGLDNQEIPFEKMVELLHPDRDLSRNPIFQVMYTHQNSPTEPYELPGVETGTLRGGLVGGVVQGTAKFDLTMGITDIDDADTMPAMLEYNSDLFDEATAARMIEHFRHLLNSIIADPDAPLDRLAMLGEDERRRLLVDWNDTSTAYEPMCMHELFEANVDRAPDAIAVIAGDRSLTYAELDHAANRLAHHLRRLGVAPGARVGLCADKSLEMVTGLLGIQKAGGAYVPLDPSYPRERLSFMLADAGIGILLTQAPLLDRLPAHDTNVVLLDDDWSSIEAEPATRVDSGVTVDDLAYVIYTSGSTGRPKGVMVEHRGVRNLADAQARTFDVGPGSRVFQFVTYGFDASVSDWLMGFATGATIVLATGDARLPGPALVDALHESEATHLTMPPSVLAALPHDGLPALRTVLATGEACPADVVATWGAGRRLFNPYGPTEATVYVTLVECDEPRPRTVIGKPMANAEIYVLDPHLEPVPVGVYGEIYIGGVGLARGYLDRPELTAERFVAHPFNDDPAARVYRTGDLGRFLPDGSIEFLGRADNQVKLRGFRIELGEIESVLAEHADVATPVVLARDDVAADRRLVAYVVPAGPGTAPSPDELRAHLAGSLPDYMVPSIFVTVDRLPLSPNGKLDRAALPVPTLDRGRPREFEPPASPTEQVVASIWARVIGIDRVGANDNFFDLGGHSLLATQVVSRILDTLQVELPVRFIFEAPTVRALSQRVADAVGGMDVANAVAATVLELEQLSDDEVAALLSGSAPEDG